MIINYPDTSEENKTIFVFEDEGKFSLTPIPVRYAGPRPSVPAKEYRLVTLAGLASVITHYSTDH